MSDLGKHIVSEKPGTVEEALKQPLHGEGETVEEHLNSVVATIGEKISLRRFVSANKTDQDAFGAYLHMDGRIGVLTHLEGSTDEELARDISMNVAAINPTYVSRD